MKCFLISFLFFFISSPTHATILPAFGGAVSSVYGDIASSLFSEGQNVFFGVDTSPYCPVIKPAEIGETITYWSEADFYFSDDLLNFFSHSDSYFSQEITTNEIWTFTYIEDDLALQSGFALNYYMMLYQGRGVSINAQNWCYEIHISISSTDWITLKQTLGRTFDTAPEPSTVLLFLIGLPCIFTSLKRTAAFTK